MISLLERKSALLMADVYPLRPGAGLRRRSQARPSARVVNDLVIVAYGSALGLLGALLHPSVMKVDAEGELEGGPDFMIGGFVAAVFVLLCILISNIDLRALQDFGRSLRKLLACLAGALVIFALLAWSAGVTWSEAQGPLLLWFVLGSAS